MAKNIESKLRCEDLRAARQAAERFGAECVGTLEQQDTYFRTETGRLKLRETRGKGAELIAYSRDDTAVVRPSIYRIVAVPDPGALREALRSTLGLLVVVAKRRELWMWQRVRIHLDEVVSLGTFIEFEAVMTEGESDDVGYRKVRTLRDALGVATDADLIGVSYSDLLLGATA